MKNSLAIASLAAVAVLSTVAIGAIAHGISHGTTPVATLSGDYADQPVNYVLLDFEQPRDGTNVPHAVALGLYDDYDDCIAAVMLSDDAFICAPYEY